MKKTIEQRIEKAILDRSGSSAIAKNKHFTAILKTELIEAAKFNYVANGACGDKTGDHDVMTAGEMLIDLRAAKKKDKKLIKMLQALPSDTTVAKIHEDALGTQIIIKQDLSAYFAQK